MKFQGDNDGDHVFFLSVYGTSEEESVGNILANSIIADQANPKQSPLAKSWEWFSDHREEFTNGFITAEQVEKQTESKEFVTLRESRNTALTAKTSIGIVSAYGRTMTTLKQMFDSYEKLTGKEKKEYGSKKLAV